MRLVMTLLARDEADIVDAQVAFHLHAGVDFVVATDNCSDDGTTEILERYERAGVLRLIREPGEDMRQDAWVTRMARLAAVEHGADWVLNTDADEFWWPRGGSLKEVLSLVPERFGVVRGCWRHFLPRPDDHGFFAERMTARLAAPRHPGDKETVYHAHQKVAHRATPDVVVELGNHNAQGSGLEPLRSWHPIEVLHFSFRSLEQAERKCRGGWLRHSYDELTLHQVLLFEAYRSGSLAEHYATLAVSDEDLERGIAGGTIAVDTRLRDALRAIRADGGGAVLPRAGEPPRIAFPPAGPREDAAYAAEAAVLASIDGVVRSEERAERNERRHAERERPPLLPTRALARRATGRRRDGT